MCEKASSKGKGEFASLKKKGKPCEPLLPGMTENSKEQLQPPRKKGFQGRRAEKKLLYSNKHLFRSGGKKMTQEVSRHDKTQIQKCQ